jgi:hypothetical protein
MAEVEMGKLVKQGEEVSIHPIATTGQANRGRSIVKHRHRAI